MNLNKRKFQRVNLNAPIQIRSLSGEDMLYAESFDFSEGGIYIGLSEDQRQKLPIGRQITLQFTQLNFHAPVVQAEVVRQDRQGCGFILLDTQQSGNAEKIEPLH